MIETIDLILPLEASEDEAAWQAAAAKKLGVPASRVTGVRLLKHSLDARQRAVKVQLRLEVAVDEPLPAEVTPAAQLQTEIEQLAWKALAARHGLSDGWTRLAPRRRNRGGSS